MENLLPLLLVLACPVGMLLMAGVGWIVAKLSGVFERETSDQSPAGRSETATEEKG